MRYPNPVRRGKPDHDDNVVHLHKVQHLPGMVESFSDWADYQPEVVCHYGGYHIWFCSDTRKVTCPKCLEKIGATNASN